MPPKTSNIYELRFDDPRLRMTVAGSFLVRVISYIAYLVLIAATATMLISSIPSLRFWGIFLLLVLADLFVHRRQADLPISELPKQGKVNLARLTTPASFGAIERAFTKSLIAHQNFYLVLVDQLIEFPQIEEGLRRLDVKPEEFRTKLDEFLREPVPAEEASRRVNLAKVEVLALAAFKAALAAGHDFIELPDYFSALSKMQDDAVSRLFNLFTIETGDLEKALIFSARGVRRVGQPRDLGGFVFESHRRIRHRVMNRAWTARPTPLLDEYSDDLTDLARLGQIGFLVGHEGEYERLLEALGRPVNPNAILVGEAGIGKQAIIEHLAFTLTRDDVPRTLFDKRLVELHLQNLVAGAPPEQLSERLKRIVEEIRIAGNVIIYIPEIHNLVKTSGTAYLSAADALMPIIMSNDFPIVGTTYPSEFKQLIEPRSDFVGAFEVIPVAEISSSDAERVLTYECLILEKKYGLTISFGAIKRAVAVAKKYLGGQGKFLPTSAADLLKSAVVDCERRGEKLLGPDRVTAVAESKVNIPMHAAEGKESEKLLHMEDIIHERLVDQEEAVKSVSQAIREYRSGLTRKGGPIASFLFVGPTGVGKTELAKILAALQFGSEKMMIRFDMTEYQDKQSFFRFVGSPDGTVHGALTDAVRKTPYSLILLDEFEKAYPDILNLFLQVLDDGRLTDNLSRTVDFTNTIVIATSNAHSDIINDALAKGETMTQIEEYLKKRLVDVFKPELLNRFSKIIIFKELAPKDLGKIVEINLQELADMVKEQNIFLSFDPAAVQEVAKLGYDPSFGARPLRRVIDEKIRAPLSEAILAQKVVKGNRVQLVLKDGAFDFVNVDQAGQPRS